MPARGPQSSCLGAQGRSGPSTATTPTTRAPGGLSRGSERSEVASQTTLFTTRTRRADKGTALHTDAGCLGGRRYVRFLSFVDPIFGGSYIVTHFLSSRTRKNTSTALPESALRNDALCPFQGQRPQKGCGGRALPGLPEPGARCSGSGPSSEVPCVGHSGPEPPVCPLSRPPPPLCSSQPEAPVELREHIRPPHASPRPAPLPKTMINGSCSTAFKNLEFPTNMLFNCYFMALT